MTDSSPSAISWIPALALAATVFAGGCASTQSTIFGSGTAVTASYPTRMTRSGFLSDYGRLKPVPWAKGIQCWRQPNLDVKKYGKVLIAA